MRKYRWIWLLLLILSAPPALTAKESVGEKVAEAWRNDVSRLNDEIRELKQEYSRSRKRSEEHKEEASWVHFRDHTRYRYLMTLSKNEESRASEARGKAETRIKQRNRILLENNQEVPKEQTPW